MFKKRTESVAFVHYTFKGNFKLGQFLSCSKVPAPSLCKWGAEDS